MDGLINGTDIVVKFGVAGSEELIYCSTTCTLNITSDTVAASCKSGGSWSQNVEGTKSWDVSVDGLYTTDPESLGGAATDKTFVDIADLIITGPNDVSLIFGMDDAPSTGEDDNIYWTGKAVCTSASLTAPDGEISTWSCTFVGNGALVKTLVPAV